VVSVLAFLMPGQGTLRVGMALWLRNQPAARPVFNAASEILGFDVDVLCARGPRETLVATQNAQPVVTVCNIAAVEVLRAHGLEPDVTAGHSVGEFSALYAAGALGLEETVRLVRERGQAMAAVPDTGYMCAVLGLEEPVVRGLASAVSRPDQPVVLALDNAPANVVVSGADVAVDRLEALARAAGARRTSVLDVSNAFHSPLMQPALARWAAALAAVELRTPQCPVVPNTTAAPTRDVATIHTALLDQLTAPVRWAETMRCLAESGVEECVEAGDSKVLTGFARAAAPGVRASTVADRVATARRARSCVDARPLSRVRP
jgi:[acyl-carrier-protein] S-malonyltransferase